MSNSDYGQIAERYMYADSAKEGNGGHYSVKSGGRRPAQGVGKHPVNGRGNSDTPHKRHTLSLFVANKPGMLIRIALVFARRGYNIDSLVVSESNDPRYSTINIVVSGDERGLDQILKQLNKLVDVVHAADRTGEDIIKRELDP